MVEYAENGSASLPEEYPLPEDLPPVEPPSAGFIVQLFLVPALIVLAVVGVWALFGKMAAGEQDWQSLIVELRHPNEHRRWRGALGLAHMLQADERLAPESRQLVRNQAVALELAGLLEEQLRLQSQREDDLKQQAFLARTLGMLDIPRTVIPVLQQAMREGHDRDVRKNAVASIAVIAGRAAERGEVLTHPSLLDDLVEISADSDPLLRQMGAFVMGLIPGEVSQRRLSVLLGDRDTSTRVNAAVGLARQGSTEGLPVLGTILSGAAHPTEPDQVAGSSRDERRKNEQTKRFEQYVAVKNALKAVGELSGEMSASERSEFRALLEPIVETHRERSIRDEARKVLSALDR